MMCLNGKRLELGKDVEYTWEVHNGAIFRNFSVEVPQGSTFNIVKYVSLYNSHSTYGDLISKVI